MLARNLATVLASQGYLVEVVKERSDAEDGLLKLQESDTVIIVGHSYFYLVYQVNGSAAKTQYRFELSDLLRDLKSLQPSRTVQNDTTLLSA